jgi:hypothetical protein
MDVELDSEEEKYKFSDSNYFTKYSCNMIQGLVPTKTSKLREKFSDTCLLVVACGS